MLKLVLWVCIVLVVVVWFFGSSGLGMLLGNVLLGLCWMWMNLNGRCGVSLLIIRLVLLLLVLIMIFNGFSVVILI